MSQSATIVTLVDGSGKSRKVKLQQELASGGAGAVYSVTGEPGMVVKLYHAETLRQDGKAYADKVACMLQHVPSLPSADGFIQIAWPLASARDDSGKFIGFAMPAVDFQRTELLESMLQPKQAKHKNLRSDLGARITVAANLAQVVSAIHDQGHYIVDLKPPNLRVYRQELYVTVLDCDGFHVNVPGQTLSAPQATPEYLAPEYHKNPIAEPEQQDRFALAVILFRILNFGIHPYDGLAKAKNVPTDREGRVFHGMYAYGFRSLNTVAALPVSAHFAFPKELRRHFDLAFGSVAAARPSAREWSVALWKFAEKKNALLKTCSKGHLWFTGQSCGACHRDGVLSGASTSVPFIQASLMSAPVTLPVQKLDLKRVWQKIESVVPPNAVREVEPGAYALQPSPSAISASRWKKIVLIQKILVVLFTPAVLWGVDIHYIFTVAIAFLWYRYPLGKGMFGRKRESMRSRKQEAQEKYDLLMVDWIKYGSEQLFYFHLNLLEAKKSEYENIPMEFQKRLNETLHKLREKSLLAYMEGTLIERGAIEGLGPGLVDKLKSYGIRSAADVRLDMISRIPGFGQVREDRLIEWRDKVESAFTFDPANALSPADYSTIKQYFDKRVSALEHVLEQGYNILNNGKGEMQKYRQKALRPLCEAAKELKQLEVNLAII